MLTLLGTSGCHLCDLAEALLQQVAAARPVSWCYQDIALDDGLITRWGEHIPVLLDTQGRILQWPFSVLDVQRFAIEAGTC
jgi:hypothetical protein